jgi:hypothetical protein
MWCNKPISKMTTTDELKIIASIRGKVMSRKDVTGVNLFLVWGYPTAFFLLLEFAALMVLHRNWCSWLWVGIPLIGVPLMIHYQRKDYDRTGHRTLPQNIALQLWLFIGGASAFTGFFTGCADIFEICYCTFQGVLVGMGCFLTGVISRFRPMIVCGIMGSSLSFAALFLQGDLWPWQLLVAVLVTMVTLIIPGHLLKQYVKTYEYI